MVLRRRILYDEYYINAVNQISAVSQLTNDIGYITETSAIELLSGIDGDRITGFGGNNFVVASADSNTISMGTNNATVMTITASGNVGIGTETPTAKLEIFEASAESSLMQFTSINTGQTSSDGMVLGITNGSLDFTIQNNEAGKIKLVTNGNEALVVDTAGNVGIGTSAPTETFDVDGTAKFTQVIIDGETTYKLPVSGGLAGQILTTDGAGETYWSDDAGLTEASAQTLIESFGYITEGSANIAFVNEGDLSALSQFNNDVGYITEISAQALILTLELFLRALVKYLLVMLATALYKLMILST